MKGAINLYEIYFDNGCKLPIFQPLFKGYTFKISYKTKQTTYVKSNVAKASYVIWIRKVLIKSFYKARNKRCIKPFDARSIPTQSTGYYYTTILSTKCLLLK